MRRIALVSALVGAVLVAPWSAAASTTDVAAAGQKQCDVPAPGEPFETAAPEEVGLDPAQLDVATGFASSRLRTSVMVFRHHCLVGTGPGNLLGDLVPLDLWSSTKSVVSLAVGVAVDRGLLDLDDPIDLYLPPGWGDAERRAITVRQLLQENSGLKTSIITEAGTVALDANIVRQGLALPLEHEPGTYFEYGQRNPDIAAYVVGRAVGEDIQDFVQREIFTPIGIRPGSYIWLRDRAGNTYGHAHLIMRPTEFARVGMLLANDGRWADRQIVSADYLGAATGPSPTNACYGMLFWVNRTPCITPDVPSRRTFDREPLPGFGSDAFATVGFLQQNTFVSPSLGTQVTWMGVAGDVSPDPQTLLTANVSSELYHEFFRRLLPAYTDVDLPDLGPYEDVVSFEVTPETVADIRVALGALGVGEFAPQGCLLATCDGRLETRGLAMNLAAVLGFVTTAGSG
ncbi:beta-lactamase [Aeromicrobium marinum DSM 15272]|uniref:Beta-lactamase n=1 Tax=Aeromicrobium marinum DSM 15272 TaxID=585531 RepID=E2SB87_9ACTN|nr:serine hydrolase [Aeromicrobium marinum]EFQ83633.1 beta-lactamase [Aeromicrobium marinum DSM 15272]